MELELKQDDDASATKSKPFYFVNKTNDMQSDHYTFEQTRRLLIHYKKLGIPIENNTDVMFVLH